MNDTVLEMLGSWKVLELEDGTHEYYRWCNGVLNKVGERWEPVSAKELEKGRVLALEEISSADLAMVMENELEVLDDGTGGMFPIFRDSIAFLVPDDGVVSAILCNAYETKEQKMEDVLSSLPLAE